VDWRFAQRTLPTAANKAAVITKQTKIARIGARMSHLDPR
jgi:hypothetical protein